MGVVVVVDREWDDTVNDGVVVLIAVVVIGLFLGSEEADEKMEGDNKCSSFRFEAKDALDEIILIKRNNFPRR